MRKPGAEFAMTGDFVIANGTLFILLISESFHITTSAKQLSSVIANENLIKLQASEAIPS
jgi:hypothetical protein